MMPSKPIKGLRVRLAEYWHDPFGEYAILTGEVAHINPNRWYAKAETFPSHQLPTSEGCHWPKHELELVYFTRCAECDEAAAPNDYLCCACRID